MSYGARRMAFPAVNSLAGISLFEPPGSGLAYQIAEETDQAGCPSAC
jgi:hypothetical protein